MNNKTKYSAAGEVGDVRDRRTHWGRMKIILRKAPISAWFVMFVVACSGFVADYAQL